MWPANLFPHTVLETEDGLSRPEAFATNSISLSMEISGKIICPYVGNAIEKSRIVPHMASENDSEENGKHCVHSILVVTSVIRPHITVAGYA